MSGVSASSRLIHICTRSLDKASYLLRHESQIYTAVRQCQHQLPHICQIPPVTLVDLRRNKLTRDACRHILAVGSLLAARHLDIGPRPVRAATFATLNIDIDCIFVNRACDVLENKIRD